MPGGQVTTTTTFHTHTQCTNTTTATTFHTHMQCKNSVGAKVHPKLHHHNHNTNQPSYQQLSVPGKVEIGMLSILAHILG